MGREKVLFENFKLHEDITKLTEILKKNLFPGTTMRTPLYAAPSLDNSLSLMVQNGRISTSPYLLPIVQPAYMRCMTDCRMLSLAVLSGISLGWRFTLSSSRTNPVISISCSLLLRFWLVVWDLLRASAMRRSLPLTFCRTFSEDEQFATGSFSIAASGLLSW